MEQFCCFSFLVSPVKMEYNMACSAWFLRHYMRNQITISSSIFHIPRLQRKNLKESKKVHTSHKKEERRARRTIIVSSLLLEVRISGVSVVGGYRKCRPTAIDIIVVSTRTTHSAIASRLFVNILHVNSHFTRLIKRSSTLRAVMDEGSMASEILHVQAGLRRSFILLLLEVHSPYQRRCHIASNRG